MAGEGLIPTSGQSRTGTVGSAHHGDVCVDVVVSPRLAQSVERIAIAMRGALARWTVALAKMRPAAERLRDQLIAVNEERQRQWRLEARRYDRAMARSYRNQPPPKLRDCRVCHGSGAEGVWEGEPVGCCPSCRGRGYKPAGGGSSSRRRRPHGRPR